MQGISISNFKSYHKLDLFGFNPCINVVMGGNGQGKSNIFKAFSFALSDKLQINRSQFTAHLHHGIDSKDQQEIDVEIVMKQRDVSREMVKISKIWNNNLVQSCYINSKMMKKKQFQNYIESLCLSYSNPYNIVQQGKINQISLMDQFEVYRLVEEITGVRKFNKRKQEALSTLKKVQLEKQQTKILLGQLDQKLKSLQSKKEQFEFLAIEDKTKKYRTKKHLTELLEATKHNMERVRLQYDSLSDNLGKLILKKKSIEQNLIEGEIVIKSGRQKLLLMKKNNAVQLSNVPPTQQVGDIEREQKRLHRQLKQKANQIRKRDKEIDQFKRKFSQVEQKYERIKIRKEAKKPKQIENLKIKLEEEKRAEELSLKNYNKQKQKVKENLQNIEKTVNSKKNSGITKQYNSLNQLIQSKAFSLSQNRKLFDQLNWQKSVMSVELQSLREVLNQSQVKIKKIVSTLNFALLDYLKQKRVKGVYGYFIEFLKIDSNVSFAYEMVGLSQLCSLLVEDEQSCVAVIEANKKLKGRQIDIIQLDYIRNRPAESYSAPKSEAVKKLSNPKWVKINEKKLKLFEGQNQQRLIKDLQKLIKNSFQKYALVKDYETGLKTSKQYHLNCITAEKQLVYSKGYHCKVGQQNIYQQSFLDLLNKLQQKRERYESKQNQKRAIDEKLIQTENEYVKMLNEKQKMESEKNKIYGEALEIENKKKVAEQYRKNVEQIDRCIHDIQLNIQKKKSTIDILTQKNRDKFVFNQEEYTKIESQYLQMRKELNTMIKQIYEIEQQIQTLTIKKQEIDQKVINIKNSQAAGLINVHGVANKIQRQIQQKQIQVAQMQQQLQQLSKGQRELEENKNHIQIKLITYQAEQEDIETKLLQIGEIQENIEQLQELSNSMSVSMVSGKRKNRHFSAKDRLLFNKFGHILESFSSHKKNFELLLQAEQKIMQTIQKYQQDSEEYIKNILLRFEKQFIDIFQSIVNKGMAEVRFKKITQKVKEVIRYRNSLAIRVSFSSSEEPLKKWTDFSGGERTVIAISMILALQRCQPAPFYVLDQIDAALDSVYVKKIAELLSKQSQTNKCQYFISTFKQDMLIFPDEICSYYLVSSQNRESKVERIKQAKTVDILKTIVTAK